MRPDPLRYEIRVQAHLAPYRLRHFAGITVHQEVAGETVIVGRFRDQPALYGLLSWLHGLGVTLLLVKRFLTNCLCRLQIVAEDASSLAVAWEGDR